MQVVTGGEGGSGYELNPQLTVPARARAEQSARGEGGGEGGRAGPPSQNMKHRVLICLMQRTLKRLTSWSGDQVTLSRVQKDATTTRPTGSVERLFGASRAKRFVRSPLPHLL